MKTRNRMELSFDSLSRNESFARVAVAAFAAQLDPTIEEMTELKTAVSEAVTNCIVHGYGDCVGKIHIRAEISEDHIIRVSVRDKGRGIPDVRTAMEPCYTTGNEDRAGMGFTIMQSFTDKLTVRSSEGKGTSVTMIKKIVRRG